ncbi:ribonuclease-like [Dermochelys coriacea]|uniref:ribonuclease-like n=1 Tax=Dermochelys coriacea TaxID=27794 RepID=UPI001CA87642|nr:ribonuclease-like [Dermochelys coriacea]
MEEADPHPPLSPSISPLTPLQVDPVTDTAMAPRGPCPLLFLILVLLATSLAQLRKGASNQQFVNQHIEFTKSSTPNDQGYCDRMMQRQGLTCPACKASNIFIHAPFSQVQNICGCGGKHVFRNIYASITHLDITECQLTSSFLGCCDTEPQSSEVESM